MAKVPNAVEILPNIWTAWVGARALETTDRRQMTDGRAIAYSEREREFTFAKTTFQTHSRNFLYIVRPNCGRGDNAVCYVCLLPVLWMTSRLPCIIGQAKATPTGRRLYSKWLNRGQHLGEVWCLRLPCSVNWRILRHYFPRVSVGQVTKVLSIKNSKISLCWLLKIPQLRRIQFVVFIYRVNSKLAWSVQLTLFCKPMLFVPLKPNSITLAGSEPAPN